MGWPPVNHLMHWLSDRIINWLITCVEWFASATMSALNHVFKQLNWRTEFCDWMTVWLSGTGIPRVLLFASYSRYRLLTRWFMNIVPEGIHWVVHELNLGVTAVSHCCIMFWTNTVYIVGWGLVILIEFPWFTFIFSEKIFYWTTLNAFANIPRNSPLCSYNLYDSSLYIARTKKILLVTFQSQNQSSFSHHVTCDTNLVVQILKFFAELFQRMRENILMSLEWRQRRDVKLSRGRTKEENRRNWRELGRK